jgi:hypothetical protein
MTTRQSDTALRPGILLLLLALLLLHALYYHPFISDDALISLRYASRLLDGHGLTWNDGERVEGYSNFLWVLASAGIGPLMRGMGLDMLEGLRVLGALGMGGALFVIVAAYRSSIDPRRPLSLAAPALFVLSAPIAVWTVGGLEQPFVAVLLAWAVALLLPRLDRPDLSPRDLLLPGLPLALLVVTRPDGALFTAASVLALLIVRRAGRRSILLASALALLPLLFYGAQLGFRLAYYGAWVPNTALAKVGFSGRRLLVGGVYMVKGMIPLLPVILPVAMFLPGLLRNPERRSRVILLLTLAGVWLLYVVVIGGDIFPAGRHLVPLVVLLAFLVGEYVLYLMRGAGSTIIGGVAWALLLAFVLLQFLDPQNRRAVKERWEWTGRSVALEMRYAFGEYRPLLAVDAAGALPYWWGGASLDMLGLNDYYLPRHRPADFGNGEVGHELGDGRYVLERRPDLVIFGTPPGHDTAGFRSGVEMQRDPSFTRDYLLTLLGMPGDSSTAAYIWMRRGGRIPGIVYGADSIVIFARMIELAPAGGIAKVLVVDGMPVAPIREQRLVPRVKLSPGLWRIEQETVGGAKAEVVFTQDVTDLLRVSTTTERGIVIEPGHGPTPILRRLILRRIAS